MFRDNFTDFAFNDIESKAMKVWITNARDIQEQLVASFQDHFITPSYTDGRHYAGTSITSQTLTVKCAAVEITEKEKRNISQWLSPRAVGALTFGFDPYHYYNVKVASEIVADKWVRGRYHKELGGYTYIYNFTIKFTTTDDWCKLGHPVNLDLNSVYFTTDNIDKLTHPFKEISNYNNDDIEDGYNIFSNFNNSYALPYVLPVQECFIQEPQKYDLEEKPNISELDSSLGNFVGINEDYVYAYFAIKDTQGLRTSRRIFICNPGNEPMYFNYFYTKNFDKGFSPEHSLKIDEETVFSFKLNLLESFSSTLNYDSYVGVLSDGGVMLPLIENASNLSIVDTASYKNIGQYSIAPGNAETIKLSELAKIALVADDLIPAINLSKDSFVFDHYGPCVVSLFNTLPRHSHKYSICSTKEGLTFTDKDDNDMLVFGGYVKSNGAGDIQILISSGDYDDEQILPYKYLSICNASFLNIKSESSNSCYLTLQTRGN
jgi:hypothetical protein